MAGNVGSIIRTIACLGGELHIIEPCGFVFDVQKIRRSAMDYFDKIKLIRHSSFEEFYHAEIEEKGSRLVLATTKAQTYYHKFQFFKNDVILFGKESAGVPQEIADKSDKKIKILMQNEVRSLNLAVSVAIILSRAMISPLI